MRKYEPIWLQLKKHGYVKIAAPSNLHATINQAVRKEKWRDAAYRLQMLEEGKRMYLDTVFHPDRQLIEFSLKRDTRLNIKHL